MRSAASYDREVSCAVVAKVSHGSIYAEVQAMLKEEAEAKSKAAEAPQPVKP